MGKFDGILMVSDLDGTILNHEVSPLAISKENKEAILYFQEEGGLFTLGTGRIPSSIATFVDGWEPSSPMISYNGAAIFDRKKGEFLWTYPVEDEVIEAVRYVDRNFPFAGIEIYCEKMAYQAKENYFTRLQFSDEHIPHEDKHYEDIPFPWMKVLFAQTDEETKILRKEMEKTEFFRKFTLTQSGPPYYEILNRKTDKGVALKKLAEIVGIPLSRTIAVGDGLNDKEMLEVASIGIAPENAVSEAKEAADYIGVHCRDHIIRDIVQKLEEGRITFPEKSYT